MIRIHQVKVSSPEGIEDQILKKLHMPKRDLLSWKIHRRSVDARGQKVLFSYVIDAKVRHEDKYLKNKDVFITPDERFAYEPAGESRLENRPVVVGFGPAGMFAALLLAQNGYRPLIVERGAQISQRSRDVDRFWKEGILDPESNVQFGMGGAGAFSDGKLTTRSKDVRGRKVLEELVHFGADPDILIEQHPHIGTDGFVKILQNMQAEIEKLGGTFLFHTRLDGIETEENGLCAITLSCAEGKETQRKTRKIPCQALILSIGHSASHTIRMLHTAGLKMERKNFAVGLRIEHLQKFIDHAMLKEAAANPDLVPARYQLSYTAENGKGVYSFCMCPGGYVIAASCEPESVVVNGMSYSDRGGENANSALLIQVDEKDTGSGLFDGLLFQEKLEKAAYKLSDSYKAPVQLASDFIAGKTGTHLGKVKPTYPLGVVFADFNVLFDQPVSQALHEALLNFEKKVPGFLDDAILTGVETRSSASIRLLRNPETLVSSIRGIYPCGEGAGYAGGIMTSAIDGLRCAMALMDQYAKEPLQESL